MIHHYEYGGWWGAPDSFGPDDDLEVESEVHPEPSPDSFTWLRQGPLAALVGMQQGPNLNRFWVPLIWYGTHAPKRFLPDTRFGLFSHLETESDQESRLRACPPGTVIVAEDFLAAAQAARETAARIPLLLITYESQSYKNRRFGITRIETTFEDKFPRGLGRVVEANPSFSL